MGVQLVRTSLLDPQCVSIWQQAGYGSLVKSCFGVGNGRLPVLYPKREVWLEAAMQGAKAPEKVETLANYLLNEGLKLELGPAAYDPSRSWTWNVARLCPSLPGNEVISP